MQCSASTESHIHNEVLYLSVTTSSLSLLDFSHHLDHHQKSLGLAEKAAALFPYPSHTYTFSVAASAATTLTACNDPLIHPNLATEQIPDS